ncbi:MAG: hypothetical protein L0Y73_05430, partial [Candidatus Aminicenantes bacterium]|nr:hypothetical protein [Candidatus Aminicenantes bacterium]
MVLKSLSSGFSAVLQNKRMVLFFYFANLVAGLIIMIPFRSLVSSLVGYSLMGKELESGLNMDFIVELLIKHSSTFKTATGLLFLFPFLYWFWNLFLSSGAYGTFIHGTGENANTFWGYSAKYFGRMFRLFLWSIPVIVLLYLTQFAVTLI